MRILILTNRLFAVIMAAKKDAVSFDEIIQAGELQPQHLPYNKLLTSGKGEHNVRSRSWRMRFLGRGVETMVSAMGVADQALDLALQAESALLRYGRLNSDELLLTLELTGRVIGISTFQLKYSKAEAQRRSTTGPRSPQHKPPKSTSRDSSPSRESYSPFNQE